MTDRRRQPRFLFLAPADARVNVTVDGDVESWQDDCAVVITGTPAVRGDTFVMQLDSSAGVRTTWDVRVLTCEPLVDGEAIRFRLRLSATPAPPLLDQDAIAP